MKDIGIAYYIFGVKIHKNRSNRIVTLSEENYIKKILQSFNKQDCNLRSEYLSKEIGVKTSEEKWKMSNNPYIIVRSLMYTMMCTNKIRYLQCCWSGKL